MLCFALLYFNTFYLASTVAIDRCFFQFWFFLGCGVLFYYRFAFTEFYFHNLYFFLVRFCDFQVKQHILDMQCTYTYRTEYILYKDCHNSNWRHIILMSHTKLNESVERNMPKTEADSFFRSKKHMKSIWFSVCLYLS